jgi:hypothetical protein
MMQQLTGEPVSKRQPSALEQQFAAIAANDNEATKRRTAIGNLIEMSA